MRETLAPFAGILERKINPILAALQALPDDVDRLAKPTPPTFPYGFPLDQLGIPSIPPQPAPAQPETPPTPPEPPRYLRPPGAVPFADFDRLCTTCYKCVEVCPAHAIQIDQYDLVAGLRPFIIAATQPCVLCDALACMKECPTHALRTVDHRKIQMGTARVNLDLCLRETGEDCRICLDTCPIRSPETDPAHPGAGDALFIHQPTGRIRVRRNACIGCGLCEHRCPTQPAAIIVEPYRSPEDPIIA
jgi:MauM/NapG family ferredoxin protein